MCATKRIFHSRLTKRILNSISFTFLSYWKTSDLHFILEDIFKKNVLKNCAKNQLKINYVNFCIHTENLYLQKAPQIKFLPLSVAN